MSLSNVYQFAKAATVVTPLLMVADAAVADLAAYDDYLDDRVLTCDSDVTGRIYYDFLQHKAEGHLKGQKAFGHTDDKFGCVNAFAEFRYGENESNPYGYEVSIAGVPVDRATVGAEYIFGVLQLVIEAGYGDVEHPLTERVIGRKSTSYASRFLSHFQGQMLANIMAGVRIGNVKLYTAFTMHNSARTYGLGYQGQAYDYYDGAPFHQYIHDTLVVNPELDDLIIRALQDKLKLNEETARKVAHQIFNASEGTVKSNAQILKTIVYGADLFGVQDNIVDGLNSLTNYKAIAEKLNEFKNFIADNLDRYVQDINNITDDEIDNIESEITDFIGQELFGYSLPQNWQDKFPELADKFKDIFDSAKKDAQKFVDKLKNSDDIAPEDLEQIMKKFVAEAFKKVADEVKGNPEIYIPIVNEAARDTGNLFRAFQTASQEPSTRLDVGLEYVSQGGTVFDIVWFIHNVQGGGKFAPSYLGNVEKRSGVSAQLSYKLTDQSFCVHNIGGGVWDNAYGFDEAPMLGEFAFTLVGCQADVTDTVNGILDLTLDTRMPEENELFVFGSVGGGGNPEKGAAAGVEVGLGVGFTENASCSVSVAIENTIGVGNYLLDDLNGDFERRYQFGCNIQF